MSCAIASFSTRTVYAATATTRHVSTRASSIQRSTPTRTQGNINSDTRCQGSKRLQGCDARPFSSMPQWKEQNGNGAVWGLTASALFSGAAYIAYESHEEAPAVQCSSSLAGTMAPEHESANSVKDAILGPQLKLRRMFTPIVNEQSHGNGFKSSSFGMGGDENSSSAGSFSSMKQPATSIKNGMLEVVEASVHKATAWEKKAKATVNMLRTPDRYDISVRALRGGRLSMEDTYCIHDGGRFAGVFDGHGGAGVSKFTSETIYDRIKKYLDNEAPKSGHPSLANVVKSISSAFDELDDEVLRVDEFQYQGSTAVAVFVHEDSQTSDRTIVSANVGDSRAVLSRGYVAVNLTRDHKPDDEHEKKRILDMGETIEWDSYCQVSRVKNLSLSRAIGDRFAKPVVSGEVEIQLFPLSELPAEGGEEDDFVVLASDGLWDVMTSQNCVDFVHERLNPSKVQAGNMSKSDLKRHKISRRKSMSRFVANEATRRGSCDNICVVIVWLNEPNCALAED